MVYDHVLNKEEASASITSCVCPKKPVLSLKKPTFSGNVTFGVLNVPKGGGHQLRKKSYKAEDAFLQHLLLQITILVLDPFLLTLPLNNTVTWFPGFDLNSEFRLFATSPLANVP